MYVRESENRSKKNHAHHQRNEMDEQNEITQSNGLLLTFLVCLGVQKSIFTIIEWRYVSKMLRTRSEFRKGEQEIGSHLW
jgi:hypothetical protein